MVFGDYTDNVPLFVVSCLPLDCIDKAIHAFQELECVFPDTKVKRNVVLMRQELPEFPLKQYKFRIRKLENKKIRDEIVQQLVVFVDFSGSGLSQYQREISANSIDLEVFRGYKRLSVGRPGLPLPVLKQISNSIKNNLKSLDQ